MPNPHYSNASHLLSVTGSPANIITLAEAKDHLEIDHSDKDSYINTLIAAASEMLDGFDGMVGKCIMEQTITWSFDLAKISDEREISLPVVPVRSITSVSYFDENNASQSIAVDQFTLTANEDIAVVYPIESFTWPTVYDRVDNVTFTLACGFADGEEPDALKHACKLIIGHWFENREASSDKNIKAIDFAVDALIGRYKIGWFGS